MKISGSFSSIKFQESLQKVSAKHNIHLQAYSSLGSFSQSKILKNKIINQISQRFEYQFSFYCISLLYHFRYSVSPAQIVLKWLIQTGWGVLPKSSNPEHIKQNINLGFELDKKDLNKISKLGS